MSRLAMFLERLLADLEFEPGGGARFRGEPCIVDVDIDVDAVIDAEGSSQGAPSGGARQWLADHIYAEWHCGIPSVAARRAHVTDAVATRDFLRTLSRANATERSWETGWTVAGVEHDRIVAAERRGARFVVSPDAVRVGEPPVEGRPCLVQVEGEQRNLLPGFYLALGEVTPDVPPEHQIRVYWHLRHSGAAPLLAALTTSLNAAGIPFWLKLLSDPSSYNRTDAAVLYLSRDAAEAAAPLIARAYDTVRSHMRAPTSPFALTIAPGLAVATDLARSASFGQHRSDALAAAIVAVAVENTAFTGHVATSRVLEALQVHGIDPAAPFRHADEADQAAWHHWQMYANAIAVPSDASATLPLSTANLTTKALELATEIAEWVCRDAVVHNGMWNWMGSDVTVDDDTSELRVSYRALGPSLYDGTTGMALFLAEASAVTGQSDFADGARGALRHALAQLDTLPADTRRGFHTGIGGVAWVASRMGSVLADRELRERARDLALALARDTSPPPLLDVISGAAGTAVALLTLADDLELDELREAARRLGSAICAGATRSEIGWSWGMNASGAEHARDLTGFAHGAGGIGWALLELGTTLGVEEFVSGAREAMRYENRWYAPDDENWPDFRESDETEFPAPSMMAWCHGAPGIMLSRTRASQLLGDPQHRLDLERGMRAAVRWLADPDVAAESSYTLCHGQLGVAECVMHAATMLNDDTARTVALGSAARGMMAHSGDPGSWLPGVRRGRNPSLMLGLAGIGHFNLRLVSPDVPSVLLWGPAGQAPNERSASRASRT